MTVVMDTSVLVAALNAEDVNHEIAQAILVRVASGVHGIAVTSEHVLGEGLTLLRRRPRRESVSRKFAAMFTASRGLTPFVRISPSERERVDEAVKLQFERYDRGLSFTDCALIVLARELECPIASFDAHFDGIVERIAK